MSTTSPLATSRPHTSGAYLAASALHNAGFRGWPLVIMTAISGHESNWNPTALNNNPSTGDYSVGLWQINYFGNLLQSRTASYGSPQVLQSDPQAQANAAYQIAGGNSLAGLSAWHLSASPSSGTVPSPTVAGDSIAPYLATAMAAVSQVGTYGPAPASQIAQAGTWPGSSPVGSALTPGGNTGSTSAATQAGNSILNAATTSSGCDAKVGGNPALPHMLFTIPHTSSGITFCQAKALMGGLAIFAGGVVIVIGMASLIVGSLGGRSKGAAAIAPVILVSRAGGRGVRAIRPRRSSSPATAQETKETSEEAS